MATQAERGMPSSARPTGTITFLFSDIEGSTSRWDADRKAMSAALARHDAVMRAALEAHGGYVFKTVGDAFCTAFAMAGEAVAAALDAQRALSSEDFSGVGGLRIRMALHTGSVEERDGDYFGPAVNRVARLLAIGHGGQVLVSGAAAELLQSELPAQSGLRDLGEHRLKDLAQPEHVYQLVASDLPQEFPALRSLDVLPNNLPLQATSFVGREHVVSEIKSLIASHRLVTVVGSGGAGKTRCAIQVAAELLDGSGDGVWLVELAPVSDPDFVVNAIAQVLNVQEQPDRSLLDTLVAYLKRKRLLLVLDNCEHVMAPVRTVVSALLSTCGDVHMLATSREPLNVSGEATYRMPSLAVPDTAELLRAEEASRFGAVQLFVERALLSNNRFGLTEENAPHVAEICRRLDGIPLAIELAAARVKVLSPQQLAQKLDERFRVLTGGDRSALPRQQTMRALIDWSYDLLSNDERALFRKLAIFAGGFTLETAAAVCSDGELDEIVVLDLLSSLVDKSLVQAEDAGSATHYRLLESTQQYAREKLREAGEEATVAKAHALAFVALAEQLDETYETTPDRLWYAQAEAELENFRAALAWSFGGQGEVLLGQRAVSALRFAWWQLRSAEGRRWVQAAQERITDDTPETVVAGLDLTEAHCASALNQHKAALTPAERAVARYRVLHDPRRLAEAERIAGNSLLYAGNIAEGEGLLQHALEEARTHGARKLAASTLGSLATARQIAGDVAGARDCSALAIAAARTAGAERLAALVALNLAETEFVGGDAARALQLADEAVHAYRTLRGTRAVGVVLGNMAAYLVALQRYDEARTAAHQALTAVRDTQHAVMLAFTLQHLAAIAALRADAGDGRLDDLRRAARTIGYVDACLAALEALREQTERREYDAMLPVLRDALGTDELAKLMAEGGAWSEDQAVAEAMLI
ncbi:MAG TPA: adenylate/guanylate cyclase domain-containing protein [Candidatus Baltobacteraceae bacterium]|nr:adenylate/guanylate cyclase domain-containing protein [Candidatus Baltobacteraceae bacterium]